MNLLIDGWIPVRPQAGGTAKQISLQDLLCEGTHWELALPRDDMELSALQLIICLVQVLLPPKDKKEWAVRIAKPLPVNSLSAVTKNYQEWFQLDHPEHPFMQVKGVTAKIVTPTEKLLPGLDSSTNSRFVNAPDLANGLCFGCVAIALYNLANNAPSFGGGFKFGVRGSCPVSTFAQGHDLRTTLWLNVLSEESLDKYLPNWRDGMTQLPTWIKSIQEKTNIPAAGIGFARGMLWQPGHVELSQPEHGGICSCCGHDSDKLFSEFKKAKFAYTIDGLWEHPHSPQALSIKKGDTETRYVGFTQSVPAWTQLSRYIVRREVGKGQQGQKPALIIEQIQRYLPGQAKRLELLVGGYLNNQAAIVERRHEMMALSQGWETNTDVVHELVAHGLKYKQGLWKSLSACAKGIKRKDRNLKGTGLSLQEAGEAQFYRRTENLMLTALSTVNFSDPHPTYTKLDNGFKAACEDIFSALTSPYQHDPELFRTLAIARRGLQRHINEIRIRQPMEDAA